MASADVINKVKEQYPSLSFLLSDPEVGRLLTDAVDPNKGYSPTTFQAKLYETKWWKRKSQSEREWTILTNTDPGEANNRRRSAYSELSNYASQLGVPLNDPQRKWISEVILQQGWDPTGPEVARALRNMPGRRGTGAIQAAAQQINALSKQYMLPMNSRQHYYRGQLVATGASSMEAMEAAARVHAAKLYPHLKGQLAAGETVRDAIAGQVELYAQELEVSPEVIYGKVWSNGWERQLLGMRDPKSGQTRVPTMSETMKMARSTPSWWKTSGGRQADAAMASTLAETFGKRKGVS